MTGKDKAGVIRFFHSPPNIIVVPTSPICTLTIHPSVNIIFIFIDEYDERRSKSNIL
jgi:hypothetical protein